MKQLDERRAVELRSRDIDRKEKEDFYKYRKMPNELNKYEREKHIEEMEKYREDLDKMKEQNR